MRNPKTLLLAVLALTLPLAGAEVITFTTDATITADVMTYDGQGIIVSNCTLSVDGPHRFASLLLTNGAVLTHSPAPGGETNNRLELTISGDVVLDAYGPIRSIPTTFFINRRGAIVRRVVGYIDGETMDGYVQEILR